MNDPFIVYLCPSPVTWHFRSIGWYHCLSPNHPSLIRCSFYVFTKCCTRRWNGIIISLLSGKKIQCCFVHSICTARIVIKSYYKFLQLTNISILNFEKMGEISSNTFHVCHAVFFPFHGKQKWCHILNGMKE